MYKVLVTGGAGFIGSNLVAELVNKDYEVIVIDNLLRGNKIDRDVLKKITLINEDIINKNVVLKYAEDCDYIFHFAALLGVDIVADNPVECMETEILGMKNILDAAILHKVKKIIYASTSGVYGHASIDKAVNEEIQLDTRTSYAIAKRFNEIYLKSSYIEKGIESVSLRFFNVYGTNQDNRMVIPLFFEQALKNEPITIFGTGKQTRDFTYIDDCVRSIISVSEKVKGCEIINVSHEKETTMNELALLIKNITNSKSQIIHTKVSKKRYDYEVERRVGSSEKLFRYISYKPETELIDGLARFYKSIKMK